MSVVYCDKKSIFDSEADVLVNPVNTEGVSGAGLALAFKLRYPDNFLYYADLCKRGRCFTGQVYFWGFLDRRLDRVRYICNFPTKSRWRSPSRIEFVQNGLFNLRRAIEERGDIESVAIPALGCGLGGLSWNVVAAELDVLAGLLPDIHFEFYPPK